MARVRKPQPTLDSTFFATPEQKVLRFLLSEPTTTFTPRVISSKLKGVRGLGGTEGIMKILASLEEVGLVDFLDNRRAVRLHDDNPGVQVMKSFASICDLEGLKTLVAPMSKRGILFGTRAEGKSHTDSEYDLCVVADSPLPVRNTVAGYPLGKQIKLTVLSPDEFDDLEKKNSNLWQSLSRGILIWGSNW